MDFFANLEAERWRVAMEKIGAKNFNPRLAEKGLGDLLRRAMESEREACAEFIEKEASPVAHHVAELVRSRIS